MSGAFTGINFQNIIIENEEFNYFNHQAIYQGSGCALLDVNEDGLLDIYFVSSQGQDKLYLNKGKFKFEDITISTGTMIFILVVIYMMNQKKEKTNYGSIRKIIHSRKWQIIME